MADNQAPPPPSPTPGSPPAPAPAAHRPEVIPDLNYPSLESILLANVEEAVAAFPDRVDSLRQSYDRLVASSPFLIPFFWGDMQGYLSRGLASLQGQVRHGDGAGPSGHAGLALAAVEEGSEGGESAVGDEQGGGDGAAKEEASHAVAPVVVEEEEIKAEAVAEDEVAADKKSRKESMDLFPHQGDDDASVEAKVDVLAAAAAAAASNHVGMESKGKGKSPDLEIKVEDGKGKIEDMDPSPEQGNNMQAVVTVAETEDAAQKAFDAIDKVGSPLMDRTDEEEEGAAYLEVPPDQANEEAAMETVSIQEDVAQDVGMVEICSDEEEVQVKEEADDGAKQASPENRSQEVAAEKKKAAMDVPRNQDGGAIADALVGEIKAEAKDDTKRASREEEEGKVVRDRGGANAGAGAERRERRQRREREPEPRRQLVAACERMDSFDVAELVLRSGRGIAREFLPALRRAPDAPALALHAAGYLLSAGPRDVDSASWENLAALLRGVRRLATSSSRAAAGAPSLEARAKEATAMAKKWIAMIAGEAEHEHKRVAWARSATWALLQFVAVYAIAGNLEVKEMMVFQTVGDKDGGGELIKRLGLPDRATELINRLMKRREHIDAVKVARAFNLIDKFPPVSVIKAYVEKVKEAAQDMVRKDAVSLQALDRAMQEDVAALRSAKEAIEAHDSGSDYRYTIMQEVHKLMRSYEKKKRSLSVGSTSSSHEHKNKRHRSNHAMPPWENQTIPGPPVYFPVPPPYFGHYNPYHPFGPQPRRN
uniref:FRIGIDA-like protein n=1 Tax=Oryza punctata TaxID=4537 RepID=A0A0E0KFZ2_ORYPU